MKFIAIASFAVLAVSVTALPHIDDEPTEAPDYEGSETAPNADYDETAPGYIAPGEKYCAEDYVGRTARTCDGEVLAVVKEGDNLWDLAKEFDVDFETLLAANPHLAPDFDLIYPKDEVCYPTDCAAFSGPEVSPYGETDQDDETTGGGEEETEEETEETGEDEETEEQDEAKEDDDQDEAAALTSGAGTLTMSLFALLAAFLLC
jgi:hypothetical protein